jgi:hypothetical protein
MCFLPKKWGGEFHDWTIEKFWPAQYRVKWDPETDEIEVNGFVVGSEE